MTHNETTVVVDEIKFFLWNFLDQDDNKRKNLLVHAYTQAPLEHDWYTVLIYEVEDYCPNVSGKPLLKLTIDSKGVDMKIGCRQNVRSTYIGREVHNILFREKGKGIIRGYHINFTREGKVVMRNVDKDKAGQSVFVVHEVSLLIHYPIEEDKTINLFVFTCVEPQYECKEDWYFSNVYDMSLMRTLGDESIISALLLESKSTIYGKENGRLTELDKGVLKILREDEVQGIIRPFSV
jgi:hypothetical protein